MIELDRYHDGALCVLWKGAKLSVNVKDSSLHLPPNHFYAKTYSENEDLAADAMASGLFEDTGRRLHSVYVFLPLWKAKS